jgi:hypothetical protein
MLSSIILEDKNLQTVLHAPSTNDIRDYTESNDWVTAE